VRLRDFLWTFVLCLFFCLPVAAQSPNGTISGVVLDPSGAIITGADILVANDATGVQYSAKTNGTGLYVVSDVPPGTYRLQVSKLGFKTLVKPEIVLNVQDALAINFTLPVGAASEIVTVEAGSPLINTENASVSTVVDQNYVKNMPLNGRSFQDLILLTPGVVTNSPQTETSLGTGGEFSVNGQRSDSNYYSIDGVSANVGAAAGPDLYSYAGASGSIAASTALGTTQALVSVDALDEFRVESSSYSAEFGRNPGGQFSFATRSGTNDWHGTAFDYLRNGDFDANDWFNDYLRVPQAPLRQNDFGGTLGGPIEIPHVYDGKDKTFFFFSYEGLRLTQPQEASVSYVPTVALRADAPSGIQPALNAFPVPQCPTPPSACTTDLGNGLGEFVGAWSNPSALDAYSIRLDHAFNDKAKLFFRFGDTPSNTASRTGGNGQPTPSSLTSEEFSSRTYTVGLAGALTDRLSNEFHLNYSSNQVTSGTSIDSFGGNQPADLAQLQGLPPNALTAMVFLFGGDVTFLEQNRETGIQRQWNLTDTASLAIGRHQLKVGIDYRRLSPRAVPYNPYVEFLYLGESQVLANSALVAFGTNTAPAYPLYKNFSAFVQDEWRITPRLNASFGLRWDVNPAPGVTQGLAPYTLEGSSFSALSLAPQGTPLWKTSWFNFAPRLGLAYVLQDTPGWETVVRVGGGVFFDTGQQLGSLGFEGIGFNANVLVPGAAFPQPPGSFEPPIVNPPAPPFDEVYYFARHLQLPYTLQWNTSVQQALGSSQAVTMSYVGAHGARLLREQVYSGAAIDNPNIVDLYSIGNGSTSDYDALQLQYQRRLHAGLTALASYTWSHCIDDGSTNVVQQSLVFAYLRGNCDFDVRHNFNAAFSYDVPSPSTGRIERALLGHWGVDDRFTARTGFPVNLLGPNVIDPVTGEIYDSNLNIVPGQPIYLYGAQCAAAYAGGLACPGGRAINPNAFSLPPSGEVGDAPRNFARGFGAWQMDFAVRREFPIYDRLKLQFRAEAFNIFNHPNFGFIDPRFGDPTFGQATGTLASTLGVVSPLYQLGGPRSVQFALKLIY